MESQGESRGVRVQLLETVNGLADGTREWRNCFLAAARGLGFETSVLEPCVLVLRNTQQKYHGIVGVAVDDIAGGRDEVWEQAISKLKQRFTFGHWEVGKGKCCSREVVQAADGSMRVGQPVRTLLYWRVIQPSVQGQVREISASFCLCTHCCRSERSVPFLPLYALLQSFVARSTLVPL